MVSPDFSLVTDSMVITVVDILVIINRLYHRGFIIVMRTHIMAFEATRRGLIVITDRVASIARIASIVTGATSLVS